MSDLALDTASRHIQRSGVTTLKLNPLSPIMTSKDVKVCYGYRCHHDVFRRYVGCWPGAARQPAILLPIGTTGSGENILLAHEDMQCDHVGRQQKG